MSADSPPASAPATPEARWKVLTRWGFPVVTLGTSLAAQVFVPRVMQLELSDGEYVAYVAVLAIAAYLGLADGGMLVSVLREMSAAHGSGDRARFAAEARRARVVFTATALIGAAIAALGAGSAFVAAEGAWPGATSLAFKLSAAAVLASTCLLIGLGSFHASMCFSIGKLLTGQIASLTTQALPTLSLLATLIVSKNLVAALFAYAGVMTVASLGRGVHAVMLYRAETAGVARGGELSPLGKVIGAGVALKAADVLPSAVFPHVLSVMAADLVPTAVPARTYANGTRLVLQQVMHLLQVHITRRMAGSAKVRVQGTREFRASSRFLTGGHLLQVGVAAALIVPVFQLWLPMRAAEVQAFVPGMLAEQALLAAALPSSVLFASSDRLRLLGVVRALGVGAGVVAFLIGLTYAREAAFGIGLCVSALPYFGVGAVAELSPLPRFPARAPSTVARYACAGAATLSCALYTRAPLLVSGFVALCGALLVPGAMRELWRMFRGGDAPAEDA